MMRNENFLSLILLHFLSNWHKLGALALTISPEIGADITIFLPSSTAVQQQQQQQRQRQQLLHSPENSAADYYLKLIEAVNAAANAPQLAHKFSSRGTRAPRRNSTHQPLTSTAPSHSDAHTRMELAAPFELNDEGELAKPEMLTSDWIEMFLFATLLLIGLPLNAVALTRLLQAWSSGRNACTKQEVTRTSFLWLKIHLTVIDLVVISCYCPSHIAWLISYTWSGGEFLCRAMQYSWDFCFHLMSFGVVGIAVDRLRTVYSLMRFEKTGRAMFHGSRQLIFVRRLIMSCYVGAAVFSIPQWFVWTTIDMRTWSQCTTIWHKVRALQYLQNQAFTESFEGELIYTLVHLMTVFWIPFLILFVAYLYIMVHLFYYSISSANVIRSSVTVNTEDSTNESVSLWQNQSAPLPLSATQVNGGITSSTVMKTVPAWRREMRSRMFHATIHVIAAYLICWMPYNVLSLATFFSHELQVLISTHLELLRVCVLLNTLLNPFIYGFRNVTHA